MLKLSDHAVQKTIGKPMVFAIVFHNIWSLIIPKVHNTIIKPMVFDHSDEIPSANLRFFIKVRTFEFCRPLRG